MCRQIWTQKHQSARAARKTTSALRKLLLSYVLRFPVMKLACLSRRANASARVDDSRLCTLMLTLPVSWRERLHSLCGRATTLRAFVGSYAMESMSRHPLPSRSRLRSTCLVSILTHTAFRPIQPRLARLPVILASEVTHRSEDSRLARRFAPGECRRGPPPADVRVFGEGSRETAHSGSVSSRDVS